MGVKIPLVGFGWADSGLINGLTGSILMLVYTVSTILFFTSPGQIFTMGWGGQICGFVGGILSAIVTLITTIVQFAAFKKADGDLPAASWMRYAIMYGVALIFGAISFAWWAPMNMGVGFTVPMWWYWGNGCQIGGVVNVAFACMNTFMAYQKVNSVAA